jgi:hypothetical protein
MADRVAAALALVGCAEALRGVLDHRQLAAGGDRIDLVHVGRLAIEGDRHDGPGSRRDRRLDFRRIDVRRVLLDVDEHRLGAEQHDHLRRRHERERGGDHLVARFYAERHQGDEQRFRARSDRNAVFRAGIRLELLLELADFGPEDELAMIEHTMQSRVDVRLELAILRLEVGEFHQADFRPSRYSGSLSRHCAMLALPKLRNLPLSSTE